MSLSLDSRAAYCPPGNLVCSEGHSAMALVHIFGEQGTQIRDDIKQCSAMNNYHDRSNLAVTLFGNTVYTLRIELYCVAAQQSYENSYNQYLSPTETSCNRAQYLGVWVDLNNDGVFDEDTERVLPSNPYEDGQQMTQYDLSIAIPKLDGRRYSNEQHRIRIVLVAEERNRKPCYSTGYGEVRDYTVQIIQKPTY